MPQAYTKRDAPFGNIPLSLDYSIFRLALFARCHRKPLILLHFLMFSYVSALNGVCFVIPYIQHQGFEPARAEQSGGLFRSEHARGARRTAERAAIHVNPCTKKDMQFQQEIAYLLLSHHFECNNCMFLF